MGFAALWLVVNLGKLAFGKRLTFDKLGVDTPRQEADFVVGDEKMLWAVLYRGNERAAGCPELRSMRRRECVGACVRRCIGDHQWELVKVDVINGTCAR